MRRRLERLAQLLRREVSHIIAYELSDPRLGFVTVTEVKPAEDLETATVFLSVMGDEEAERLTMAAIGHARGHIQSLIGARVKMRRTPILIFRRDEGVKRSVRVSALLHKLAEERGEIAPLGAPEDAPAPDAAAPPEDEEKGPEA